MQWEIILILYYPMIKTLKYIILKLYNNLNDYLNSIQ